LELLEDKIFWRVDGIKAYLGTGARVEFLEA
jgi:hypothetical protein